MFILYLLSTSFVFHSLGTYMIMHVTVLKRKLVSGICLVFYSTLHVTHTLENAEQIGNHFPKLKDTGKVAGNVRPIPSLTPYTLRYISVYTNNCYKTFINLVMALVSYISKGKWTGTIPSVITVMGEV
jgi:hypothetical protein